MKTKKQIETIECLNSGKYKVIGDQLLYLKKGTGEWHVMKPINHKSGYQQYRIGNSVRNGLNISVVVYRHILIYLHHNGKYPSGWHIDHINRDNTDNRPENLQAKPPKKNIANSTPRWDPLPAGKIRGKEIKQIRGLLEQGMNQSQIARMLGLNRLTVRYTINNIKSGKPLKYENYKPNEPSSAMDILIRNVTL